MARNNGDRTGLVGILFLWVCSTGTHYVFFGSTLELDLWKVFIWLIVYFIYCWWRCPNAVLVDGGIYFLMRSADKPGRHTCAPGGGGGVQGGISPPARSRWHPPRQS